MNVLFACTLKQYDVGRRKNFEDVFGTNPWLWWFPVDTLINSGSHFPAEPQRAGLLARHREPSVRSDALDQDDQALAQGVSYEGVDGDGADDRTDHQPLGVSDGEDFDAHALTRPSASATQANELRLDVEDA